MVKDGTMNQVIGTWADIGKNKNGRYKFISITIRQTYTPRSRRFGQQT